MALITPYYQIQRYQLYKDGEEVDDGHKYVHKVRPFAQQVAAKTILDYGCGQGSFKRSYPDNVDIRQYDPVLPHHTKNPDPADVVVCTNFLERVEPRYLSETLNNLYLLTNKVLFVAISLELSDLWLPNGHNANLTIASEMMWLSELNDYFSRFHIVRPRKEGELVVVCFK